MMLITDGDLERIREANRILHACGVVMRRAQRGAELLDTVLANIERKAIEDILTRSNAR